MRRKKKSVKKHLLLSMLCVAVLTAILFAVVSAVGLNRVQEEITYNSAVTIENIADDEAEKMINIISKTMEGQCKNMSLRCAKRMETYMEKLQICTDIVKDIYENPDHYGRREISAPSEETRDRLCMYYSLNESMVYEDYREEVEKIACSEQNFRSVYENSRINSIYYTTKEGILFSFDENSGEVLDKLGEGQSSLYLHDYEPRAMEWYKSADKEGNEMTFSSTYSDTTGNLVVTCSQSVYKDNEFMGVLAMDIFLGNLEEELLEQGSLYYEGIVEITDNDGNVIISPNIKGKGEKYKNINIRQDEEEGLVEFADAIIAGKTGIGRLTYKGQESEVVYTPIDYVDWRIAIIYNRELAMEDIYGNYRGIMEANEKTAENVKEIIQDIAIFFLGSVAVVMAMGALFAKIMCGHITKPIERLIGDVHIISNGNLDHRVHLNTEDELEELGEAFNEMTMSLKEHMQNLEKVTADRERISTELEVAARIQQSLLPEQTHGLSKQTGFDIGAFIRPAKEVGGDFYDYFMTDENHVWLIVADVSGKGIPASLFMMMGKTLIKNQAEGHESPAEIMRLVNRQLSDHNDAMMFITCFIAIVDLMEGTLTYANAGHNFPIYGTESGVLSRIENTPDIPLAVMGDAEYENHRISLSEGDMVFLYTDGVTEAMNREGALYGEERLCSVLKDRAAKEEYILHRVWEDISEFARDAVQADDITMLVFLYRGKQNSIKVPADLKELSRVLDYVEESLQDKGFDREFITAMKFISDELFSNIVMYAYEGDRGDAVITVHVTEEQEAELVFEDWGTPYNPLEKEAPDVTLPGEQREEGGLGIYLVRGMADEMEYEYTEGRNVVRVRKYVAKEEDV